MGQTGKLSIPLGVALAGFFLALLSAVVAALWWQSVGVALGFFSCGMGIAGIVIDRLQRAKLPQSRID
jgi:hypothetical protein